MHRKGNVPARFSINAGYSGGSTPPGAAMINGETYKYRWTLALQLLNAWRYTYPTKYIRWAYHEIEHRRARGIPTPFDGE